MNDDPKDWNDAARQGQSPRAAADAAWASARAEAERAEAAARARLARDVWRLLLQRNPTSLRDVEMLAALYAGTEHGETHFKNFVADMPQRDGLDADKIWADADPKRATSDEVAAYFGLNRDREPADDPPDDVQHYGNERRDLALRFAHRHEGDLRFVAKFGRWLKWDKTRWRFDDTMAAFNLVRTLCRKVAGECNKESTRAVLASAKTVAACERLAKADRRLAATSEQWDVDPYLLATPSGVVDLRTGHLRPARQSDYMTKTTSVGPGGACPRWREFLKTVTAEDAELEAFIQRVLGYGLTGSTVEHAMFFAYGTGANGKSVLLGTVAGIMGDYHCTAPIEAFVTSHGERHPKDLAGLRGARLVTAIETEEGRRWAENKLKAVTGGDRISARFMRQDFFEFLPLFKLLVAGNHKPALRSVDEAIKRRLHLIPFTVTIPVEQRNKELVDELKAE